MANRDLFGDRAREYARVRPAYPEALFDHLETLVPARALAWDCGAGTGQASRSLARRFERAIATDSSRRQLAEAYLGGPHVHAVAAMAEAAPIRDRSVDLVVVSAALHWFDRPRFFAEVARVARPGAILAAWSYYETRVDPAVDAIVMHFANEVISPWWPPGMQLNRDAYRPLDVPFERLPWPEFAAEGAMRLDDLLVFMRTWSASQAWQRERGVDPVETVRERLAAAWGDPERERPVRWPLHGVIARVTGGESPPA